MSRLLLGVTLTVLFLSAAAALVDAAFFLAGQQWLGWSNYFCYGTLSLNISTTAHTVTAGLPANFSVASQDIEINPLTAW